MDDATYIKKQVGLAEKFNSGELSQDEYIRKQANLAHSHIEGGKPNEKGSDEE